MLLIKLEDELAGLLLEVLDDARHPLRRQSGEAAPRVYRVLSRSVSHGDKLLTWLLLSCDCFEWVLLEAKPSLVDELLDSALVDITRSQGLLGNFV